MSTYVKLKY